MPANKKTVTRLDSDFVKQYDMDKVRQQAKKKRLTRRLVVFAIIMVMLVGGMTIYHLQQRTVQAKSSVKYVQLQDELTTLKNKESDLREEINLLKDDDYVLKIARANYFFSNKGELIFKIPDKESAY